MLSERQIRLLQAIIGDYIQDAEPVGSVEIVKKHNFKCSPATVRNEMAKLIDLGFLQMLHSSSGRIPTKTAYRMYIEELMSEEELPVLQEVALKQRLWSNRFKIEKLLRESVLALSENTKYLAMAQTEDGYFTSAGAVNVLENKEFWDIDVAKAALSLLDQPQILERIFKSFPVETDVKCAIEGELGIEALENCSIVFAQFSAGNTTGYISVMGPSRLNYPLVIPTVRYTKNLLEELGGSW